MLPSVYLIAGVPVSLHDTLVGLGMLAGGIVLLVEGRRRGMLGDEWWWVVFASLMGAVIGARVVPMLQHWDFSTNGSLLEQFQGGTRSIIGGLAGAYAGVLVAKRLTRWQVHTGDAFAPAVALGMAIGRIGCLLTETPGTPTGSTWGITLTAEQAARLPGAVAGVPLHPSFAYEIAFHLTAFAVLWTLRKRPYPPDYLFRRYILSYAVFRFVVEFVRGNEQVWWGLSRPQWFLLVAMVGGLLWRFAAGWWRARKARAGDTVDSADRPARVTS